MAHLYIALDVPVLQFKLALFFEKKFEFFDFLGSEKNGIFEKKQ